MKLDELKIKRISEARRLKAAVARTTTARRTTKQLTTDDKGRQVYVQEPGGAVSRKESADDAPEDDVLGEGKKFQTPEFVRHCVTAITERPADLERVKKDAPGKEEGSPFAICNAKYNDDKRSLAAKHSKGEHHSNAQYKEALAKLREDVEEARSRRTTRESIIYSDVTVEPSPAQRHLIRYVPRG